YQSGAQESAELVTGWYGPPRPQRRRPILTIAAAGRIHSVDPGHRHRRPATRRRVRHPAGGRQRRGLGRIAPIDIGPAPSWRNLRVPLDQLPRRARTPSGSSRPTPGSPPPRLAVTPPARTAHADPADRRRQQAPVLLDWSVGLAFRASARSRTGTASRDPRVPHPARPGGAQATNAWQDAIGGGPLGWTPLLLERRDHPDLPGGANWRRDWGSLERFTPIVEFGAARAGGWSSRSPGRACGRRARSGRPTRLTSL
nr:arabinosyltransferase [Prescottella equi]